MHTISRTCPHCQTERASFGLVKSTRIPKPAMVPGQDFLSFFVCGICSEGILVYMSCMFASEPFPEDAQNLMNYQIKGHYPQVKTNVAPDYTPDSISKYYLQGCDNVARGNYDAAGMMFRKVVDTTTKHIGGNAGKKLYQRIEELAASHTITPSMAEWAHQVRLDGNDAAHEDAPFTQAAAEDLQGFTELLLMYIFSLPGMLDKRRAANIQPPTSP